MTVNNRFSQFNKLYPRTYGKAAFYIRIRPGLTFRVYKIAHLFSCVRGCKGDASCGKYGG